jgi:hypothetical protein
MARRTSQEVREGPMCVIDGQSVTDALRETGILHVHF